MENNNSKRNLQEEEVEIELPPGFRFHPTDEELITHYLSPKVIDSNFNALAIGEADLNKSEPWDLPGRAKMGEKEWYFFCVKDRKYPTGLRTNRATESGYWKATGKDKEINRGKRVVGMKKTLVFYKGRAPKGEKSNWVMHEYRLEGKFPLSSFDHRHLLLHLPKPTKNEWVICRIFKKSTGEKRTHISELVIRPNTSSSPLPPLMDYSNSFYGSEARASHVTHPIEHNVEECKPQTTTTANNMIYNFKTHNYYNHSPSSSSSHSSNPSRFLSQTPFHVFPNPKQPPVLSTNNQLHHSGKENPDSVWMQGNSIMRMLLEDKQRSNPKMEISQDMALGFNDQIVSSSHGIMANSCCMEDEDFDLDPYISDGPIDLESLWNY